ncbi:MAG: TIGR03905 family TSCPD domain-containing protein [Clostridia bacterium]|nr:TIGR03905 family TSCPD domain-containing protein [Clostridia bacterium]
MTFSYKTKGVCSQLIEITVEDDIIRSVKFVGGCNGNLKGIGKLVEGMHPQEVIEKLKDIKCGFKNTSCPAQLACALTEYLEES